LGLNNKLLKRREKEEREVVRRKFEKSSKKSLKKVRKKGRKKCCNYLQIVGGPGSRGDGKEVVQKKRSKKSLKKV
jgi:hypothetical protein